jgi:hypothetical protein
MFHIEETKPQSETSSTTLNEGEEQTVVEGKKPFVEPTVSVSLNILDATAFFQGTAAADAVSD